MGKKCLTIVITAIIIIGLILINGCGGSGSTMRRETHATGDAEDIDALLGLSDSKDESGKEDKDITEDDVLKLLGVVDEGGDRSDTQKITQSEEKKTDYNRYDYKDDSRTTASDKPERTVRAEMDTRSYVQKYNEAFQLYEDRKHLEAIEKFNKLILEESNHKLADNCQYWIGECYYDMGNFEQAIVSFEKVFSFTNSNKDADAQLKIGICYHRLNRKEKAKEEFQRLITYYPDSEYVSIARSYLNKYN